MSQKISAKNLSYTQKLPPFLAAMHSQASAARNSDSPDPILAGRRRAAKPRSGSAEAEDAPLVLDEDGNVVDGVTVGLDGSAVRTSGWAEDESEQEDGEGRGGRGEGKGKAEGDEGPGAGAGAGADAAERGVGTRRKRKAGGKVIGSGGAKEEEEEETKSSTKRTKANGSVDPKAQGGKKEKGTTNGKAVASVKNKKANKIKLSFGDDGD